MVVVTNVESLEGFSDPSNKKVVTVSAASLGLYDVKAPTSKKKWTLKENTAGYKQTTSAGGTSKVMVNKGYTLAPASTEPTAEDGEWTADDSTATYTGYSISTNGRAITYSKATEGTTLATIEGAKVTKGITGGETTIRAKASALTKDNVADEYAFEFGTDYKAAKISGGGKCRAEDNARRRARARSRAQSP